MIKEENIVIPALTLLDQNKKVSYRDNTDYVRLINKSKVRDLILFGTTGLGPYLSVSDKCDLLKLYQDEISDDKNIIICPSVWSIKDFHQIVDVCKRPCSILYLPNIYFFYDLESGYNHCKNCLRDSATFIYNLPHKTSVSFDQNDIGTLRNMGVDIKGIKLSHADMSSIQQFSYLEDCSIYFGSDRNINTALSYGAKKVVSQNLAASLPEMLNNHNLQSLANKCRDFCTKSNLKKINALYTYYYSLLK